MLCGKRDGLPLLLGEPQSGNLVACGRRAGTLHLDLGRRFLEQLAAVCEVQSTPVAKPGDDVAVVGCGVDFVHSSLSSSERSVVA
jgi:hypothetical protein